MLKNQEWLLDFLNEQEKNAGTMCRRGSLEEEHISGGRNQEFTFGQGRSAASLILPTELLVDLNIHMVFYIMGADEIT